jgi:hypothetical protein
MLGFFKKKTDPLADRQRALNAQIAALENQIKGLQSGKATEKKIDPLTVKPPKTEPHRETVFEIVPAPPTQSDPSGPAAGPAHYNDLGARKFDLVGVVKRIRDHFRGPTASNPKLVSYLAAGSIKGLRPLRYEKRVARNRFVALFIFFVLLLWGILAVMFKQR